MVKKTAKTKKSTPELVERKQWLIVALLVVILFAFGCLVYAADMLWKSGRLF